MVIQAPIMGKRAGVLKSMLTEERIQEFSRQGTTGECH
jgi:hypothetical protein